MNTQQYEHLLYLQGVHADFLAAGYTYNQYTDSDKLKADMANHSQNDAFARLYLYWYTDLCKLSTYPLYGCHKAYIYTSKDEKCDVEQEIIFAFIRIILLSVEQKRYKDQQPADIRRQVTHATKLYAQDAIHAALGIRKTRKKDPCSGQVVQKYERTVMSMDKSINDIQINGGDTTIQKVLKRDAARLVATKIEAFLAGKSPEYKEVFEFMLDKKINYNFNGVIWEVTKTEASVAKNIGKSRDVVANLKAKIRKEFAPYWAKEIKPYV